MEKDLEKIWQTVLGELEVVLSKPNFTTWFKDTFIYDYKKGIYTIGVRSFFFEDTLKKKFSKEIRAALQKQSIEPIEEIKFKVASLSTKTEKPVDKSVVIHSPVDNSGDYSQGGKPVDNPKNDSLKEYYTFENFIVGASNQLAHAAAQASAKKPGKSYNPLFIYGQPGLGKTHLAQAIGNFALSKNPRIKVLYATCETFTNDFIDAVRSGKAKDFKDRYRNVDILIIDDIQFLGTKEITKEEFFHTFNHLHQKNKQLVLTSDRPPKELKGLEKRLITRFEWGMVADIQAPNYETRLAILKEKCQEHGKIINEEILEFIAKNINDSIRELEGALTKLLAHIDLINEVPSVSMAERILSDNFSRNSKKQIVPIDKVIKAIQKFYNISFDDIVSKRRNKEIIKPRHMTMYILHHIIGMSFPDIGRELGGKDHTTIMHGCKSITKDINNSKQIKDELELLKESIFE
ncbi:MAG: chromosomal replication initiator protein DnaA [Candidatus Berkelbacteria bacterium]|nr:chromosomal replication initiator protein DnaA [Candidatus Berkelbacteria bacterium]